MIAQAACTTKELTHSFRWTNARAFQQHDVQEFFSKLFSAVEDATEGYSMVTDLYEGKMVDYLSCQSCTFERRRTEAFRELELEIGIPTVLQSLNAYAAVWYIVSAGRHQQVVSPCAGIRARNCCPATTSGSVLAVTRKWTQPRASSCKMSHPSSHYTSSGTRGVHPWAVLRVSP